MLLLLVITVLSLAVAAVMSVVAWRLAREQRRGSDARVEALATEIHGENGVGSLSPGTGDSKRTPDPVFATANDLFAAPTSSRPQGSLVGALAIGILVVGTLAALAAVLSSRARPASTATAATVAAPATARPLELVALGHEREGDRLTVRGVVRNPAGTARVERLTAVVFVFNGAGRFVTSARAPIEGGTLESGGESTFVVAVTGVDDVGRYRVSFRSDDRIVAHVDRRDNAATTPLP